MILCIPIIFGFCLWFLKAPVVRYGIFYINAIIFILFMIIFNQSLLTKFNRVFIIIILTIAITFNISKNLIRVFAEKDYKEFPFPVIEKIKYDTKIYNQLKLNTPISQGHIQSGVCWDTPVYCRTNTFDDLNIEKKRGYIIFTKKNN